MARVKDAMEGAVGYTIFGHIVFGTSVDNKADDVIDIGGTNLNHRSVEAPCCP